GGLVGKPLASTRLGSMAMGMRGPSAGTRIVSGALGGGGIGGGDAALRGEDPIVGGRLGAAGRGIGPILGGAARGVTNFIADNLPKTGPLKGVHPIAVNKLTSALEGETPASIQASRDRMGPAGFVADLNPALTDMAGGLSDIPGPNKALVREGYRLRHAQQGDRVNQALDNAMGSRVDIDQDRKSTRLNSSHVKISYAAFCVNKNRRDE